MSNIKCVECEKLFESEESLIQHVKTKHKNIRSKIRPPRKKHFIQAIFVIIFVLLFYWVYSYVTSPGEYDDLAKCLTEKRVNFYGAFWCPHCSEQKQLFGKSIKYVTYIECSTPDRSSQTQICISENITSYPTWEFPDGAKVSGFLSLKELSSRSGCQI